MKNDTFGIPVAVLHIGPHKTETTLFQKFIFVDIKTALEKENYFSIPHDSNDLKKNGPFSSYFIPGHEKLTIYQKELELYQHLFQEHLKNGSNMMISGEGFDRYPLRDQELFNLLKGFEIRVLIVYREYVGLFSSFHNEFYSSGAENRNILQFIDDCLNTSKCLRPMISAVELVDRYEKFIPRKNIFLMDLQGILSNKKNLLDVMVRSTFSNLSQDFLSDLLKTAEISMQNHLNQRKKTDYREICLSIFLNNSIKLHPALSNYYANFTKLSNSREIKIKTKMESCCSARVHKILEIPKFCANEVQLKKLKSKAKQIDDNLRGKYSDRIFNGNTSANKIKIDSYKALDFCKVDNLALFKSELFLVVSNMVRDDCLN